MISHRQELSRSLAHCAKRQPALPKGSWPMRKFGPEAFRRRDRLRLKVIVVARISTGRQDERSLEDQKAYCLDFLGRLFQCEFVVIFIKDRGSGEYLDRKALHELEDLIDSGDYDIVVTEDLGRICRRSHAMAICEACEDADTRLIAINDHVDLADENWRVSAFFAALRHEQYNQDTAKRIRRSQQNRFSQGGALPKKCWGYLGWENAQTDTDLRKVPALEQIIPEALRRLEEGATFAEIADWFHDAGVPTGPSCRKKRWTVASVARSLRNPMLKGVRERNRVTSRRKNKTGRRYPEKNDPSEWQVRHVPHLAYVEPSYFDHVMGVLKERNKNVGRPRDGSRRSRAGIPTKRTIWPLQHARCGICGWPVWRAGTYSERVACCSGALKYQCWNGMMFQIDHTQQWILNAVLKRIQQMTDFETIVRNRLEETRRTNDLAEQKRTLEKRCSRLRSEVSNLIEAIKGGADIPAVVGQLKATQTELSECEYQLQKVEKQGSKQSSIPTQADFVGLIERAMHLVIAQDDQTNRLLCRIFPKVTLFPVVLCDGGAVKLQAEVEFDLSAAVSALTGSVVQLDGLRETVTVDLFDTPAYVRFAELFGTAESRNEKVLDIAKHLGISFATSMLARRLHRKMRELGVTIPYQRVTSPPDKGWRCRRHKHPRYRFDPCPPPDEGTEAA